MKRYQVYLDPQNVRVLDEISELSDFSRSTLIQELVDAAANRAGNLLATLTPPKLKVYSELDKIVGSIEIKKKKVVNLSENVDEIYYK